MKTVQQLQQEVYQQALGSGYFRNMQAQLKSYVFDIIQKQYGGGKNRGFQYQHPLLQKMRQYPLTSLCMDLIQEFLESFKFKHTLNVFKKQINRNYNVSRNALAEQFRIQIRNPEAQAVLVSIVTQMVSGQVGAVRNVREQQPMKNNFMEKKQEPPVRTNYMMSQPQKPMASTQGSIRSTNQGPVQPTQTPLDKSVSQNYSLNNNSYSASNIVSQNKGSSIDHPSKVDNSGANAEPSSQISPSSNSNVDTSSKPSDVKEQNKGKDSKKKAKPEKEKPPEGATDLLGDVMQKFKALEKVNKQQEKKSIFEAKRAFSQEKKAKVVDQAQSGANKIRGGSMGKGMSSLMSKFMPQAFQQQQPKNQSYVDEQLDEFQISRDSTRRNPLFSSSESGFDKSGFDYSVDSNSIDQYEYSERARKVFKKG